MASLAAELERRKLQEWERHEGALAIQVAASLPTAAVSGPHVLSLVAAFIQFCEANGVRYLPARPATVAAYVLAAHAQGMARDALADMLVAIQSIHDDHGMSNPTTARIVRMALEHVWQIEPPRSWNKTEKISFAMLPPETQAAIERREREREKEIRRMQNATAEKLRQKDSADPKPVKAKRELSDGETRSHV